MRNTFLSRFTPSLMSKQVLEDIFVQRERLAARTVRQVRDGALVGPPAHVLFVGPRGIGKTHLVSLLYHRLKDTEELQDRLAVAWLPEDEASIASFLDLLIAVVQALVRDEPGLASWVHPRLDALYDHPTAEAALALVREAVGDRALLLLVENLDDVFAGLGDTGQKALRAFLQESRTVTLLATARSLFGGVSRHAAPFYGFFRMEHLGGLTLDEAMQLLTNIARLEEKADLVAFLGTPAGRARVRALEHLVGGNPRLYVIFSEFLSREQDLDELVPPFLDMLDDLTPYYQAKMRALSPQQRKIVDFLSGSREVLPVKEIARRTLIGASTVSSQLKQLREMGYVRVAYSKGRETIYELKEPLMRLCLSVKKEREEPIRLFVEFLRLWWSPKELENRLAALTSDAPFTRAALREALRLSVSKENPMIAACRLDYEGYLREGNREKAQQTLEELRAVVGKIDPPPHGPTLKIVFSKAQSLWINSTNLLFTGHYEEAQAALEQLVEIEPDNAEAWSLRAAAQSRLGYHGRALADMDQALKLDPNDAWQWENKAVLLHNLGLHDTALESHDQAINLDKTEPVFYLNRSATLLALDRWWEGFAALRDILPRFGDAQEEAVTGATINLVQQVLSSDLNQWRARVEVLVIIYATPNQALTLGMALTRSVRILRSSMISPDARRLWHATWQDTTAGRDEFTLPLRLLGVAVRYLNSGDSSGSGGDPRVLLELPSEERELLKPLLGVQDGAEDEENED